MLPDFETFHCRCGLSGRLEKSERRILCKYWLLTFWRWNYFFNFSTLCVENVSNTGTKYVRIMKQTAFLRGKNGEYTPCLKYSVTIFVE